ncbi:MAG: GNAT family N-acetyltransferase [Candidatus Omnitrophica bacterium]|nr:GNAT family N-acetyltransferase [Candidatus Omnitrophota bacterium]
MDNKKNMPEFDVLAVNAGPLLEQAFALRKSVFFGESGKEHDQFDKLCEHIVVIERNLNRVVGTYRLLLGSTAAKNIGFYSETEFNLENIKKNCQPELLEMGRACVDPEYRKYPILAYMWKAIASYVKEHNVNYLLGCASIEHPTEETIGKIFTFLKANAFSPQNLRVTPLEGKAYPYSKNIGHCEAKSVVKLLPSLMRNYLKIGAYACGEPVWDKVFDTADFFMLLDFKIANMPYLGKFI